MSVWRVVELALAIWLGGNALLVLAMVIHSPARAGVETSLVSLVRPIVPEAREAENLSISSITTA